MRAAGFFAFATVATLLPVLVVAWNMGAHAPFWFLAGDAYLYLGIGETSSGLAMSFDGIRPTNGFHPMWQVFVRAATAVTSDQIGAMTLVAYGAVAFTYGGVLFLGTAIQRLTGSWLLAMLAVPGAYYLIIGQALQNLPVWAFFDGMEAGLAFFLAGIVAWMLVQTTLVEQNRRLWIALGLALAFLVLTRLDDAFVPFSMAVALAVWRGRPIRERFVNAAWLVVPTTIAVGLFLTWSYATTGMLSPVSGAAKGEGALLSNGWVTLVTVFSPLIDLREGLTSYTSSRIGLLGGAFRVIQLVVPALFAIGLLVSLLRRYRAEPWAPLLAGLCSGIIIKAAYNFAFVNYWHQATWYYAVAMMTMTLGTAILIAPAVKTLTRRGMVVATLALGTLTLFHSSVWSARLMTNEFPATQRDFWVDRDEIQAAILAHTPDARVLEFGDGMINFTLDMPVRHGFVFAGDAQSLNALRLNQLLRHSYADGFTLLSSYEYLLVPDGAEDWTSDQIRTFLEVSFLDHRVLEELSDFDYEMVYVHRPTGVPFIALTLRQ